MLKESPIIQRWQQIIRDMKHVYRIHPGTKKSKTDSSRISILLSEEFLKLGMKAINFIPYLEAALYESALELKMECDELDRERDSRGGKISDALKLHNIYEPNDLSRQLSEIAMKILTDSQMEMTNARTRIETKQLCITGLQPRRLSTRKPGRRIDRRKGPDGFPGSVERPAS